MENKKTINYLNSKVWYRFLKVLYIMIFCLISLLIGFFIFKTQDDPKKYVISCTWNNQSFVDGVVYADQPFSKSITSWSLDDRLAVAGACLTPSERDLRDKQMNLFEKAIPPTNPSPGFAYDAETFRNMESNVLSIIGIDVHNNNFFKVKTPIETRPGILKFLGIFVIALLAEFLVFKIIRIAFYYVILGKIRPEK